MLSAALLLFANTLLFSLRLSGGGSFPKPLSAAEEREYLRRYAQGDQEARDVLIERNLRLVAHIIKNTIQSADQEDLISIGTIGLIKGISSFDPEKGARLATYAARCIENEILMYFRSQKKLQGEVSLSDSIETDKEGNALQLMDVVGVDDTMLDDIHDRDSAAPLHQIIRGASDHPGGGDHSPAVRAGRHHPPDPEGNCRLLRDFPVLCIPHRKAGAGKAAPGAAGRPCAPAGPAEAPFLRDVTAGFGKQRGRWKISITPFLCALPRLSIAPHHGGHLAQYLGIGAVNGGICLILRQQPYLTAFQRQALNRRLVIDQSHHISPCCAVGWL